MGGKRDAHEIRQAFGFELGGDLSERLDLLAGLYRAAGKLTRAIRVLEESKQLCATHGIPFNGRDLLRDYLQAKKARVKPKLVRKKV